MSNTSGSQISNNKVPYTTHGRLTRVSSHQAVVHRELVLTGVVAVNERLVLEVLVGSLLVRGRYEQEVVEDPAEGVA